MLRRYPPPAALQTNGQMCCIVSLSKICARHSWAVRLSMTSPSSKCRCTCQPKRIVSGTLSPSNAGEFDTVMWFWWKPGPRPPPPPLPVKVSLGRVTKWPCQVLNNAPITPPSKSDIASISGSRSSNVENSVGRSVSEGAGAAGRDCPRFRAQVAGLDDGQAAINR